MDIRSLGYRTDLMIRLLEGSRVDDRGDYLVIRTAKNPTYWWGNFLLLAEPPRPGLVEHWLDTFASEFPGAEHVAIGIDVTEISGVDIDDVARENLRLDRSSVLTATAVHEPPHANHAVTCREISGDHDWQQAWDLRAIVNAGEPAAEPEFHAARIEAERAVTEAGHGSWFGAFADGQLVAQLGLVTDGSGVARYQHVETHPQWRRQGLAGTLVWHAGQHGFASMAAKTLVLVADPEYVAIRVYRSVGFVDAETQIGFERQPA